MDAWVACKHKLICDTKLDGLVFEFIDVRTLLNTLLPFVKQIKKCVQRDAKLFARSVHEPINESVNENGINEMLGKLLKECYDVFLIDLPNLPSGENILGWYHLKPPQGMVKEPKMTKLFS